ncbi:hypothetical protein RAS1_33790 [Phycisphaerae bacterium RAS1]|nr:hypothetical protein RAS1_33790 [Phycisphaerae bacterium RAS1]
MVSGSINQREFELEGSEKYEIWNRISSGNWNNP